jgi:hypothetical protein
LAKRSLAEALEAVAKRRDLDADLDVSNSCAEAQCAVNLALCKQCMVVLLHPSVPKHTSTEPFFSDCGLCC